MTGYQLRAGTEVGDQYYYLPAITLYAGDYLVVHWNADGIDGWRPPPEDNVYDCYTGTSGTVTSALNDNQGYIALFFDTPPYDATICDYIEHSAAGQPWEAEAVAAGIWPVAEYVPSVSLLDYSLGRCPNGVDTDDPSDWQELWLLTQGEENSCDSPTATPTCTPTGPVPTVEPEEIPTVTATPTPTVTPTPLPNFLEMNVRESKDGDGIFQSGESLFLSWRVYPELYGFINAPLAIYVGVVMDPAVADMPGIVGDVFAGGPVFLFGLQMAGPYRFDSESVLPTFKAVPFPPVPFSGEISFIIPEGVNADMVFAAAFINRNTGEFVSQGKPVEFSNRFTLTP